MDNLIKSVVCLGAPKCSTSHLGKFFEFSDNFDIVRHPTNRLECYEEIFDVKNLEYKFAKTPSWIFVKDDIDKLVHFYSKSNVNTLFVVTVREYNYLLKSFYTMRLREWPTRYDKVCFEDWVDLESLECPDKSYGELVSSLRENILYLISTITDIPTISFVLLTDTMISQVSTLDILKSLNVDIKHEYYKFHPHQHSTKCEFDFNNKYHTEFTELINDEIIKSFLWHRN